MLYTSKSPTTGEEEGDSRLSVRRHGEFNCPLTWRSSSSSVVAERRHLLFTSTSWEPGEVGGLVTASWAVPFDRAVSSRMGCRLTPVTTQFSGCDCSASKRYTDTLFLNRTLRALPPQPFDFRTPLAFCPCLTPSLPEDRKSAEVVCPRSFLRIDSMPAESHFVRP